MEVMPFGKFKGSPFADVPNDYFEWLLLRPWLSAELCQQVEQELARRAAGAPAIVEPDIAGLPAVVGPELACRPGGRPWPSNTQLALTLIWRLRSMPRRNC